MSDPVATPSPEAMQAARDYLREWPPLHASGSTHELAVAFTTFAAAAVERARGEGIEAGVRYVFDALDKTAAKYAESKLGPVRQKGYAIRNAVKAAREGYEKGVTIRASLLAPPPAFSTRSCGYCGLVREDINAAGFCQLCEKRMAPPPAKCPRCGTGVRANVWSAALAGGKSEHRVYWPESTYREMDEWERRGLERCPDPFHAPAPGHEEKEKA